MLTYFDLTVRFLQPMFHGRGDGAEPEWPPSPLRVFQSLVAASAARWSERMRLERAAPALGWLERQPAPSIIAAAGEPSRVEYRLYVPDNVADKVAASWSRGGIATIADYRTEKDIRPIHLAHGGDAIHYLWPISDPDLDFERHKESLFVAARSITHLGWGIDMVAADATVLSQPDADRLPGERWRPTNDGAASGYRVPMEGTLKDLLDRHEAFLNRLGPDGFRPVPPLSAFRVVGYRRASDPEQRQFAAFSILKPDASGFIAFDTPRHTRDVAGMVRHAVADAARRHGWPDEQINVFVHGKTPDGRNPASGDKSPDRFSYFPLPSINHKLSRVESIRRVLIAAPACCREQIAWVRRALGGEELKDDDGRVAALLTVLPGSDWVLQQYLRESATWSTVTPVILPGHDDRSPVKTHKLLRTAFTQAGYAPELINDAQLEWRRAGFRPGVDLPSRYLPPKNLENKPRYHVLVRFPHAVRGPLAIGSGRFRGFGLFATMDDH